MSTSEKIPFVPADHDAVTAARIIPMQVVQDKGHGHAGTAVALAPLSHVLFSRILRHSPANPTWAGRDRFVLSAGHASLLLYVQNYLSGYGLELDEIALARSFGSRTPGHPEVDHTPGVEMSTGPLGQGLASAVGMAMAATHERGLFGGDPLFDHTVWALAGDGCLQEGVSAEASSLAGTLGLDNLVVIWDDNNITIDSSNEVTFSEDVRARYRAYGWRVLEITDANNLEQIEAVLADARRRTGQPTFVALRSVIGYPSAAVGGTSAAHAGPFGAEDVAATKRLLGVVPDATLHDLVSEATLAHTRQAVTRGLAVENTWNEALATWAAQHPVEAAVRERIMAPQQRSAEWQSVIATLAESLPEPGAQVATRKTNGAVIQALHDLDAHPGALGLWGGSADLAGSTSVAVAGEAFSSAQPDGAFIRFGIREHAMMAILNGIALHSPWRPYGSTYLVFSDYLRPALRLSALMELPTVLVLTHDSVAVGEDGPTHQPIEQTAGLRTVPNVDVVRPADPAEVLGAWHRIADTQDRPTALILSRQDLPVLPHRDGVIDAVGRGGYVAWQSGDGTDIALIATGSEVSVALAAAETLTNEGLSVRVVSMPCTQWFDAEDAAYRESVLPPSVTARVAVEAGVSDSWWKYVGLSGRVVGINRFGISGSGAQVMAAVGITAEHVVAEAHAARVNTAG